MSFHNSSSFPEAAKIKVKTSSPTNMDSFKDSSSASSFPVLPKLISFPSYKIFISYYHWDLDRIAALEELVAFLKAQKFSVLNFSDGRPRTATLQKKGSKKEADILLICLSENYNNCNYCRSQALSAVRNHGKPFIAISLDLSGKTGWPEELLRRYSLPVIDFSETSVFVESAMAIFRQIHLRLSNSIIDRLPTLETIRVRRRLSIPTPPYNYFHRIEEEAVLHGIMNMCQSTVNGSFLVVTGQNGVGKSTLVHHVIGGSKYDRKLAVECRVQYVAWLNMSGLLDGHYANIHEETFFERLLDLLDPLYGVRSKLANCARNEQLKQVGSIIDQETTDLSCRFLLVLDKCERHQTEVLTTILELESKTLRCILTTSNIDIQDHYLKSLMESVSIRDLEEEQFRAILRSTSSSQLEPEKIKFLKMRCHGSAVIAGIYLSCLKETTPAKQFNFPPSSQTTSKNALLCSLKSSLEFENAPKVTELYCYLIFFDPGRNFTALDVCAVSGYNEDITKELLSKFCQKSLLAYGHHSDGVQTFVMHEVLHRACYEMIKVNLGLSPTIPLRAIRKRWIDRAMLNRTVESKRENVLLQVLGQVEPHFLEDLCRDQLNQRTRIPLLQRIYSADWKDPKYSTRNISAELTTKYLQKLLVGGANIVEMLALTDPNWDSALLQIYRNRGNANQSHRELTRMIIQAGAMKLIAAVEEKRFWAQETEKVTSNPLYVAAIRGQLQNVHSLLKTIPYKDVQRKSMLAAAANGHADVVRVIQWQGGDVNAVDGCTGDTALIMAARNGHIDIVEFLCSNGADVTVSNSGGSTAVMGAAKNGHCEVVRYLAKHGAEVHEIAAGDGVNAFILASEGGHVSMIKLLISLGVKIDEKDKDQRTAFIIAAEHGHTDIVVLLKSLGADIHARDRAGHNAIIVASQNGYLDIVEFLLKHGADVTGATNRGVTALIAAVKNGHTEIAKALVAGGSDLTARDHFGISALNYAVQLGQYEIAEFLCPKGLTEYDRKHGELLNLAITNNHSGITELLIRHGVDVNAVRRNGQTALSFVIQHGNIELVKLLIVNRANVNQRLNKDGTTPVMLATGANGKVEIVEILRKNGADINTKLVSGWTVMMNAALNGNHEVVACLIANGVDVNAKTASGITALIAATKAGHTDVVRCLIKCGADSQAKTIDGISSLGLANASGCWEIVQLLQSSEFKQSAMRKLSVHPLLRGETSLFAH